MTDPARMKVQTANALITGAPVVVDQLQAARTHYAALVELLAASGPRFSNSQREAVNMHNIVIRRLRENAEEQRLRAARTAEIEAGLVEIEQR